MSFGPQTLDEGFEPFRLVVIVGHTLNEQGAPLVGGGTEYSFNKRIAELMFSYAKQTYSTLEVRLVFRDTAGINGAYREAERLRPDACLELHFNAANGKARGTETLCTPDEADRSYAEAIQSAVCPVFEREGNSRGVKVIPRNARGGLNVYSLPGSANCLVEPFFGDNKEDAEDALKKQGTYAEALVDATVRWVSSNLL